MIRRLLAFMLALCLCVGLAGTAAATQWYWSNPVHETAQGFMAAVEAGQESFTFTGDPVDGNVLLSELIKTYPMLSHYYKSAQWLSYPDRTEMTVFLKNQHDSLQDLWMVDSDEDLLAAMGLGISQIRPSIQFITYNGYIPSEEAIEAAAEQLHYNYYLAYMGYHWYSASWTELDGDGVRDYVMNLSYFYELDSATLAQWRQETQQAAQMILTSVVAQDMPQYRKALVIHDWLVNNCKYNIDNMEEAGNHLAWGPLVRGWSVCMGYAEAALMLLQAAGLEAYYISGDGINAEGNPESHAWNAVKVDGQWYLMDVTWDDPVADDHGDYLYHTYFLVTDSQLAEDHVWDRTGLPVCDGTAWNAELALAAYEQDTAVYYEYDASRLVTVEQAQAYFSQNIVTAASVFAQTQNENLIEIEQPTEPATTQPVISTEPATQPSLSTESLTEPVIPTQPIVGEETQPGQREEKSGLGGVIVIVLLLTGGGSTLVVLLRNSGGRKRRPGSGSAPNNPFASGSGPSARSGPYNPFDSKPSGSGNPFGSSGKTGKNPWDL